MRGKGRHIYPKEPRQRRGRLTRLGQLIAVGAIVSMLSAGIATADEVRNNVVSGGNDTITAGGSTTIQYRIKNINLNGGDTQNNCNPADTTPATITLSVPANVTASTTQFTLAGCEPTFQGVTFSSNLPGNYAINVSNISDAGGGTYDNFANFTLHVTGPSDTTPPVISSNVSGTQGNNGWYTSNVTLTWTVTENESPSSLVKTGCVDQNITADQAATTYSCSARSDGGAAGPVVLSIKRDATQPVVSCDTPAPSFLLNQSPANVTASVSDATSGPKATSVSGAADTSSVGGSKNISLEGEDEAGNKNSASCSYSVGYKFAGFFSPVENPSVMNIAKAGQAIPLKWRLLDANDAPVTNLTSVSVTAVTLSCNAGTTSDNVEEYAAGGSGLQNLGDGYYQFNWKTPTNYANSCKTMNLNLGEGSNRTALFQFRK
jgi:hypothetical protein